MKAMRSLRRARIITCGLAIAFMVSGCAYRMPPAVPPSQYRLRVIAKTPTLFAVHLGITGAPEYQVPPDGRSNRTHSLRQLRNHAAQSPSRDELGSGARQGVPGKRRPGAGLWGRLATCGGLITRLPTFANGRPAPVANRRAGYHPAPQRPLEFISSSGSALS